MFEKIVDLIENIGIVPVIKLDEVSDAAALSAALTDGGINCAEVTFRNSCADKVIAEIRKSSPDMLVGAGTVLNVEQAARAIDAGARFMVAPGLNPKVVEYSLSRGVPFIPGVSSGSEIEQAMELGLNAVKFFPAEQAGGIAYIKALSAPYSDIRFMPTGGVGEKNICDYLAFDKVFACGGSWMVSPALLKEKNWKEITRLSRIAVNCVLGFEFAHVGVNGGDGAESMAQSFSDIFGFDAKSGNSSIFASSFIEIMRSGDPSAAGHIGIKTNSVKRAMYSLGRKGLTFDLSTAKYDDKKRIMAVYLKEKLGGCAVHLLQKK